MVTKFKLCKRFNEPGHAHELTFSCYKNQPFLAGDRSRDWLADAIKLARRKHAFHLWAYVFMPEHVHLLIWPTKPVYDISSILTTIKLSVTRKAHNHAQQFAPQTLRRMADVPAKFTIDSGSAAADSIGTRRNQRRSGIRLSIFI
jgi:putative transposase